MLLVKPLIFCCAVLNGSGNHCLYKAGHRWVVWTHEWRWTRAFICPFSCPASVGKSMGSAQYRRGTHSIWHVCILQLSVYNFYFSLCLSTCVLSWNTNERCNVRNSGEAVWTYKWLRMKACWNLVFSAANLRYLGLYPD